MRKERSFGRRELLAAFCFDSLVPRSDGQDTSKGDGGFELKIEARPDWPADTCVLVRTNAQGNRISSAHRPSSSWRYRRPVWKRP
jgi:hypothetical protein